MGRDKNSYSILNVRKGASDEEIKRAYVALVKKYDPENHVEQFMIIKDAYERLRDPKKRAQEDLYTFNPVEGEFMFNKEERVDISDTELQGKIKQLEMKLRESPDDDEVKKSLIRLYMQRSYKKVKRKLWSEAISDWQQILNIETTHHFARHNLIYAYIYLGYSYAIHGLYEEALELWEQALQMNPDNTALLQNIALAYELAGNREKARTYWMEVVKRWRQELDKKPDDEYLKTLIIEVHKHYGSMAATDKRDKESALQQYREILKIQPDDFDAHYQIAATLLDEQKWDMAIEELNKLLQLNPKNVDVLNMLGWALLNAGQVDAAFNAWKKSLQIDPKNAATRDNLIRAHLSLGKRLRENGLYTPALVHFKALLKYLPRSPEVHFEIGSTYLLRGDIPSAYNEFNTVLKIDPRNKLAKKALSELKLKR
ncbi:tetratricopeptide repeat protein [Candidatus Sumerlaeota bacterium]|nr:tetratricopeptide repeat protein [Candidatus Sumerlaeota bacterium]